MLFRFNDQSALFSGAKLDRTLLMPCLGSYYYQNLNTENVKLLSLSCIHSWHRSFFVTKRIQLSVSLVKELQCLALILSS